MSVFVDKVTTIVKIVIMSTIKVTATQLKRNTSHILNQVVYGNKRVLILKYGVPVAEIIKYKSKDRKEPD